MKKPRLITPLFLLAIFSLTGCGGSSDSLPGLTPVSGTVSLDGEPVVEGSILFTPEKGRVSNATTDENGNYELFYKSGIPGAVHGKHTVSITATENMDLPADKQMVIPAKYNTRTTLEVEISGTEPIVKDFNLTTGK